jgi:hypothetical protein
MAYLLLTGRPKFDIRQDLGPDLQFSGPRNNGDEDPQSVSTDVRYDNFLILTFHNIRKCKLSSRDFRKKQSLHEICGVCILLEASKQPPL